MEPLDPLAIKMVDWRKAQRDALRGIGTPADWMVEETDLDEMAKQAEAAEQAAALAQTVGVGAEIAQQVAGADQAAAEAQTAQAQVPQEEAPI